MDDLVETTRGMLPRDDLYYRDVVSEDARSVNTARIWFHKRDGAMVRQDAWVALKRGLSTGVEKGM